MIVAKKNAESSKSGQITVENVTHTYTIQQQSIYINTLTFTSGTVTPGSINLTGHSDTTNHHVASETGVRCHGTQWSAIFVPHIIHNTSSERCNQVHANHYRLE